MTDFISSNKFLAVIIITAILIILVNIIFILKEKYEKKTSGVQYAKYIIGSIDVIISTLMLLQCDALLRNNEDTSLGVATICMITLAGIIFLGVLLLFDSMTSGLPEKEETTSDDVKDDKSKLRNDAILNYDLEDGTLCVFEAEFDKGVEILFKTKQGDLIDIARVIAASESNFSEIKTYVFGDVQNEDYTHLTTVTTEALNSAIQAQD